MRTSPSETPSPSHEGKGRGGGVPVRILRLLLILPCLWLPAAHALETVLGKALFERLWVSSPASTASADGLGPLYNARSCESCHRRGGRGRVDLPGSGPVESVAMVPRLTDDPSYGWQIQTRAVPGLAAEARLRVDYSDWPMTLANGTPVTLRRPVYRLENLAHGPLHPDTRLLPRLGPSLHGLGLVERLPDEVITALADPHDRDGDSISGRVAWQWRDGRRRVGRYGWQAELVDLQEQTEQALLLDLGLSTPARPVPAGDCTQTQRDCLDAPHGQSPHLDNEEVSAQMATLITRYVAALPAPPPADTTAPGARLFREIGCAACHRPRLKGEDVTVRAYSDFLLHDLGPELEGEEWRTAPLWGLGRLLAEGAPLLHDGRARDAVEAILWHGGEADASRQRFRALPAHGRRALLDFLETL